MIERCWLQIKLDKERAAQIQSLVDQGQHSELEEAIHAQLIQKLNLKKFGFSLGFSPSYLCSYQKELACSFLQDYFDSRADEKQNSYS